MTVSWPVCWRKWTYGIANYSCLQHVHMRPGLHCQSATRASDVDSRSGSPRGSHNRGSAKVNCLLLLLLGRWVHRVSVGWWLVLRVFACWSVHSREVLHRQKQNCTADSAPPPPSAASVGMVVLCRVSVPSSSGSSSHASSSCACGGGSDVRFSSQCVQSRLALSVHQIRPDTSEVKLLGVCAAPPLPTWQGPKKTQALHVDTTKKHSELKVRRPDQHGGWCQRCEPHHHARTSLLEHGRDTFQHEICAQTLRMSTSHLMMHRRYVSLHKQ